MKLRIEKAVYGGDGLARVPERARRCLFPERCRANWWRPRSPRTRRSFATGELDAVLEPSPERVVPGCEYVPRCGGCQYQHASPAFQLQMKLDILKETLARAHSPFAERNRESGRAALGLSQPDPPACDEAPRLGYRQRGSHDLLPVTHCPIAAPLLEQAIAAVDAHCEETASRACARKWNSLPTASRTSCWSRSGRRQRTAPARTQLSKRSPSGCRRSFLRSPGWGCLRSKARA